MGRAEPVPEEEVEPRVTNRAFDMRRHVNAWGVCHGHPKASQAYYDLCRRVYNAERRVRLTQEEQESILKKFNLMGEFNKIMDASNGTVADRG